MRTDRELVEASRRGEQAAFGELVSRYQGVVTAVSYSSTGDQSISEDVAQDTFVAAWQTLDRLRDVMALGPWLCGIARNLGRKARKRARPNRRVALDDDLPAASTPFDEAMQAQTEHVVSRALERVPIACREVLVLYYREQQSIREVAVALGITEAAVMQRLARGRRYLADEVTEIVERSLGRSRKRRDLAAAVLASIAAITLPSRVDASPAKGSTMLKVSVAASALVGAGTVAYLAHARAAHPTKVPPSRIAAATLHYGREGAHPQLSSPRTLLAPSERAQVSDDLALLPEDSEIVFGIDAAQLRTSGVWKTFVAPKLAHATSIAELTAACGFDPLSSIESIQLGIRGLNTDRISGVFVVHGLDKTTTDTCLNSHHFDDLTFEDGVALMVHDGEHVGFTFTDDRTLVFVLGSDAATKDGVLRVAAGGGHLDQSPAFADLFQHIHSEDTMWMLIAPSAPLFAQANEAVRISAAYGSIDVADGIVVDARLRLGSPAQVASVVDQLRTSIEQPLAKLAIERFCDAIDVTAEDNDVRVDAAIGPDQLALLSSLASIDEATEPSEPDDDKNGSAGIRINFEISTK